MVGKGGGSSPASNLAILGGSLQLQVEVEREKLTRANNNTVHRLVALVHNTKKRDTTT